MFFMKFSILSNLYLIMVCFESVYKEALFQILLKVNYIINVTLISQIDLKDGTTKQNVRLLSQFTSSYTGRIYDRGVTGLCLFMQKRVAKLIKRARMFGLCCTFYSS